MLVEPVEYITNCTLVFGKDEPQGLVVVRMGTHPGNVSVNWPDTLVRLLSKLKLLTHICTQILN